MEHEASKSVKEQSKMETAIKTEIETAATSTAHIDSDVDLNHLKQEPGLVQTVKCEPALLVKEEILEDSSLDINEQQSVKVTLTPGVAGSVNEACGTSLDVLLLVKQELEDMKIGPTVLQHMDIHYTMNKNRSAVMEENAIVDDCNEAMPSGGVEKESAEEKLIGSITNKNVTMNKQSACCTSQNPQLAVHRDQLESICRVNLMRLDTFQCGLCDAAYTEKCWLLQHLKIVHRSSLQTSLFVKYRKANKHQSTADNQIKACKGLTTTRADYDKVHLTSSHIQETRHMGEKPYQCTMCDVRFTRSGALSTHIRVHTGEKPYRCSTCDARFARSSALSIHMRVHTAEKPYRCSTCDARFADRSALTRHVRVHTGEKPYRCSTCGARFAQSGGLSTHLSVHTGDKPFQCTTCDARFTRSGTLSTHMSVHTGEKPYQCTTCHVRFAHNGGLTKHMKRVHTSEKPLQCTTCDARFADRSILTRHVRVHTGEKPYRCSTCGARFARSTGLTTHMSVHTGQTPYR